MGGGAIGDSGSSGESNNEKGKSDATPFIAAGGTRGDLDDLIAEAPGLSIAIRRNVFNSQSNVERN